VCKSFLMLLFLFSTALFAQSQEYSTKNKSAIKSYEKATQYYDVRNNQSALKELQSAISKDENFVEAYILAANVYVDMNQYEKAIEQYQKAVQIAPDFFPNNWYSYAQIELNIGKYTDAKTHFDKFLTYQQISPALKLKAQRGIVNCDFATEAMKHPVPFKPENVGGGLNSRFD